MKATLQEQLFLKRAAELTESLPSKQWDVSGDDDNFDFSKEFVSESEIIMCLRFSSPKDQCEKQGCVSARV